MQPPTVQPSRLVLLGDPVAHSLSPLFQNAALRDAQLQCRYELLRTPASELASTIELLRQERAAGNVTVPHKEAFATHCTVLSETARRVGAVNTFWFVDDQLIGDNTDVAGATAAIDAIEVVEPSRELTSRQRDERSCVVLGAGGSAAAVLVALANAGVRNVFIVARNIARARSLVDRLQVEAAVSHTMPRPDVAELVINTTPVGLLDDELPFDVAMLPEHARVLDLVYKRGGTALVRAARARGLIADDGLRMLVEQGAQSFERWFGKSLDRQIMWRALESVR